MLVLGKSRTPAARAGRRSLESFPLLKEVIGEREVRRKEEGGGGEEAAEESSNTESLTLLSGKFIRGVMINCRKICCSFNLWKQLERLAWPG